ncbi:MAG: lysoplasmalogenase family protein [Oscillospiraceae bacterium]
MTISLFLLYSMMFTALMLALVKPKYEKFYLPAKTATSITFLLVAFIFASHGDHLKELLWYLPAFLLCFCGDVLLGNFHKTSKQGFFIAGLVSFLLGHLAFIYNFAQLQPLMAVDFIIPVLTLGIVFGLTKLKDMDIGKMTPAVYVYAFFIALLLSKSLHLLLSFGGLKMLLLASGSLFFLLSDMLILFLYFYKKQHIAVHVFNLATYYLAMFLLALSLNF